jgi:murein DD-endopeptidase MepM/ murein hydrolase activator NlpD
MKLVKIIFTILLINTVASCKTRVAPIVNHSGDVYGKNAYFASKYNKPNISVKARTIKIESGDTLYGVAKKYNVNIRDLIEENNLSAPYNLRIGSTINIPQANYHEVQAGETLYGISRDYKINVNEIIALNKLEAPYNIYSGQKIKIGNDTIKQVQQTQQKPAQTKVVSSARPKEPTFMQRVLSNKDTQFAWPIKGQVISKFGPKEGGLYNDGINIKASLGDEVKAAEEGIVAYVGNELKGYGNLIILKHSGGWISAYGHLGKTEVKRGEKVEKLQKIAGIGATGNVDSAQLYFGLRKGRDAVNPEFYLK